jgi:amidase
MELPPYEKIDARHKARQRYADAWRRVWVEHGLDVVLSPGAQNTAVTHDTYGWPPYTLVWNLLDVCPQQDMDWNANALSLTNI